VILPSTLTTETFWLTTLSAAFEKCEPSRWELRSPEGPNQSGQRPDHYPRMMLRQGLQSIVSATMELRLQQQFSGGIWPTEGPVELSCKSESSSSEQPA